MTLTHQKKKKSLFLLLTMFLSIVAMSQNVTVTGRVTDSKDGSPIPGASILAKGTTIGTKTDGAGSFSLDIPKSVTALVLSSVGFETREISVGNKTNFNVALSSTASKETDVVVVGYGTRRVKDATGSVAAISAKDFNKGVISTPEQLFQGRTPGVTITPNNGEPGAAATINIRGTSSIRGNNEPLYVVDGVPLDGGGTSGTSSGVEGSSTPKNPLLFLNPNDIESISILKDASSAAIYGSRGANGVIIITTKSGRGSKGAFSFSSTTSFSTAAKRYDLLNATDFLRGVKAANIAAGTSEADATAALAAVNKGANTDWQDQIFQTGVSQNFNLGWGFSKKATALRLSGSYDDQKGIVKSSGLKRLTGRANLTQKFLEDKLKFDVSLTASNVKNQYAPNTNNAGYQGSLIGAAIAFNPTFPVKNADGTYYDPLDGNRNPAEMIAYFDDRDVINRLLTNLSASYKLTKNLVYKATLGFDKSKSTRTSYADPRLSSNAFGGTTNVFGVNYNNPIAGNGRGVEQLNDLKSTLIEHTLTFDKTFNEKHNINAVGGYSYQNFESEGSAKVAWGLNTPVVGANGVFNKSMSAFKNTKAGYVPWYNRSELQSYFGRVNYSYDDRYLLTATVRVDGSSKFGTNNKYGTFPAFAAKWKILNESFAQAGLGKVFSDFSVRANYGKLGSQDGLDAYSAINLQQTYLGNSGSNETVFLHQGNKDLKWEEATTVGVGLDFALKSRRLSGTIDYYQTKRKNLIFYGPVPGGFSASSYYFSNLPGYVLNTGVEVSLNLAAVKTKSFNWDINYNMTFLKNELRDFNVTVNTGAVSGQGLSGAYAQTFANGYPLFTWKMPVFNGYDGSGNAIYDKGAADQILGGALPTFTAGLTNNFSYNRWNASIFMNMSKGFYVYNNTANALFLKGSLKTAHNVTYDVLNSKESPINPGSVSTRFLEKGDFLRLSNASLGYSFNIKNKYIKSLSASLSGQNLFLITNYSGLDPEVNVDKQIGGVPSRGFDYAGYPKARTISIGINVGF